MLTLSVVLVCFGEDNRELLAELGRQRRPGDEVILVDNACERGGTDWIREDPQADLVIDPGRNLGYGGAVNLAAARAAGDAILVLNPDAMPQPGCLDALRAPPEAWGAWMGVVTLPGGERLNAAGGQSHFLGFSWAALHDQPVAVLPAAPYETGFLSGACTVIRMSTLRAVGGYAEAYFMYHEDVDLSHRMRLMGIAFGVLPQARVTHDYEFFKGAMKWRMLERNRWKTVLRTYPAPVLALVLPPLLLLEPLLLAYAVRAGWARAKLRAWWDLLVWLPRAPGERRTIQRSAVTSAAQFAAALTDRLDSPFFGRLTRWRCVQTAMRVYWRGAARLLRSG